MWFELTIFPLTQSYNKICYSLEKVSKLLTNNLHCFFYRILLDWGGSRFLIGLVVAQTFFFNCGRFPCACHTLIGAVKRVPTRRIHGGATRPRPTGGRQNGHDVHGSGACHQKVEANFELPRVVDNWQNFRRWRRRLKFSNNLVSQVLL